MMKKTLVLLLVVLISSLPVVSSADTPFAPVMNGQQVITTSLVLQKTDELTVELVGFVSYNPQNPDLYFRGYTLTDMDGARLVVAYSNLPEGFDVTITDPDGEVYTFYIDDERTPIASRYIDEMLATGGEAFSRWWWSSPQDERFYRALPQIDAVTENRYGYLDHYRWMRSYWCQQFGEVAHQLLFYVVNAPLESLPSTYVVGLTWKDLDYVFGPPVREDVLEQGETLPVFDPPVSFGVRLLEGDQQLPGGGYSDYFYCWNQSWSLGICYSCCSDWFEGCTIFCLTLFWNPTAMTACELMCATCYLYCRYGCRKANPQGTGGLPW